MVIRCIFYQGDQASKRNAGCSIARFDLMLFIDSDCTIHTDLLICLKELFSLTTVMAAAPPVYFDDIEGMCAKANAQMPYRQAYNWGSSNRPQWWLPAATLAVRREAMEKIGHFWAPSYGPTRGEDVDWGLRLTSSMGYPAILTLPNCPSRHAPETWCKATSSIRRAWWFGWSEGDLRRRHFQFQRWSLPPFLTGGILICLTAISVSTFITSQAIILIIFGAFQLCIWLGLVVRNLHSVGMRGPANIAFLGMNFVYNISRTLSLWFSGSLTGGMWFHELQIKGAWEELVTTGWLFWALGMVTCLTALIFL